MWRLIRDWLAPSLAISSQTQCSPPSQRRRSAARRVGSASAARSATGLSIDDQVHGLTHMRQTAYCRTRRRQLQQDGAQRPDEALNSLRVPCRETGYSVSERLLGAESAPRGKARLPAHLRRSRS